MATPDDVVGFWFADGMAERWFAPDPDFDRLVRQRLLTHHEHAAKGVYDVWMQTPRGCLALCILLDQVPRNVFRGTARAFATDAKALAVARHALEHGLDRGLSQPQRLFLYLPFEHSEALADQARACELMQPLGDDLHDWALRHKAIIERFGRFPHRNAILGRVSTPEEIEFLKQPGSSF
jgi:uncharacterized protein (DUF924 family)